MRTVLCFIMMLGEAGSIIGCRSTVSPGGRFAVPSGGYPNAFDASREVLIDLGFELDRIDAPSGVLATESLTGRGIAAPWERQQQSSAAEFADLFHGQSRSVRIEFVPAHEAGRLASNEPRTQIATGPAASQIETATPMIATVTALIERTYRPSYRPQIAEITRSTRSRNLVLQARGIRGGFDVVVERDRDLEALIAGRIATAIGEATQSVDR